MCLFCSYIVYFVVVVVVVGGNVSKCEANFQGATKKVNLEQWPLNHLSKVGEYMNGYLQSYILHYLMPHSVSIRLNFSRHFHVSKRHTPKTKETKVHNLIYSSDCNHSLKDAKKPPTTHTSPVNSTTQSEMTSTQPRGKR